MVSTASPAQLIWPDPSIFLNSSNEESQHTFLCRDISIIGISFEGEAIHIKF